MEDKSSFLGTFLAKGLKTNQLEVNTDEKTLRPIARLKEPRDLFALPKDKDNVCSQQAPRWPVECQVIEERINHIPYVPTVPEPLNVPTGNEIKPRPVGEENGTVVFNYNPISAVNYDDKKKKQADDSSDTDSDTESVTSATEKQTELKIEKNISKFLESLSSSNSNDDDSDGDECDVDSDTTAINMRKRKMLNKKKELKEIPKIAEDEIEDIWADKTPEYTPSTPISIRHRIQKQELDVNKEAYGGEYLLPTFVAINDDLKENLIIKVESIINSSSEPSDGYIENDLRQKELKAKLLNNIQELRNKNAQLEVKGNYKCKENAQNKENSQTQGKQNISNETQINNDSDQNADDDSLNLPQFSRSSVGGSKILTNCHPYNPTEYDGLEFESRFESGNLAKAVQITPSYYELYLRSDLYTNRSKQWFYFRVKKTKKHRLYRFSIVNLVKSDSLFNDGMRPVMYSTLDAKQSKIGWRRCGENISYYHNEDSSAEDEEASSFTLTFNIEFQYDNDTVYFAHCYPYTYSDLQDYLMNIQKDPIKSKFCKLRLLCRSLAGNNVYYLTVTAPSPDEHSLRRKKSIVVSARVHPSETPSSWMMKGLMDFITGETMVAKRLRHKFIFKLIPMLNPDGVIVGNTRNSLTGKDLNRQYRTVIREYYPSIWYTKALIKRSVANAIRKYKLVRNVKRLVDECGVAMYCDMHAHSRRHNIFIYGCENKRNPEKKLTEQVFPLMMHKNVADKFSFECCKFKVQRSKEGTGRIVVWMLGITNSYTIEASFGGTSLGSRKGTHFNTGDYEHMGRAFCETLLDYYDENPNKVKTQTKYLKQVRRIRKKEKLDRKLAKINRMAEQERLRLKIIERLLQEGSSAEEPLNIPLSDYSSDEGTSSSSDNEGKNSMCLSDLEGPCCAPIKAPPTSPMENLETRRFKLKRMRKIMRVLDRIYFQPILKKKLRLLDPSKKKYKVKKCKKTTKRLSAGQTTTEEKKEDNTKVVPAKKTNTNRKNEKKGKSRPSVKEIWAKKKHKVVKRKLRLWLAKHHIMIYRSKKKRTRTKIIPHRKKDEQARIPLDMPTTDPGTDLHLTDEEFFIDRDIQNNNTMPRRSRVISTQFDSRLRINFQVVGDSAKQMPPELIITSPTKKPNESGIPPNITPDKNRTTELPLIGLPARRTHSFTSINQNPKHLLKTRMQSPFEMYTQQERNKELELKLSLKKKVWTGTSQQIVDNKHSLEWGLKPRTPLKKSSANAKPPNRYDADAILNGCSKKLMEIQQTPHPIQREKHDDLSLDLTSPRIAQLLCSDADKEHPSCSKPQKSSSKVDVNKAKPKRKRASLAKFSSATQVIRRLTKTKSIANVPAPSRPTTNNVSVVHVHKTRSQVNKFKTGGIVATAIQPISKKTKKVQSSIITKQTNQQPAITATSLHHNHISKLRPIHATVEATDFVHKVKRKLKQAKA